MPAVERRALIFFAVCVVISLGLEAIDVGGAHSIALRLAAMFSLAIGIAVLLIRANQKQRSERDG